MQEELKKSKAGLLIVTDKNRLEYFLSKDYPDTKVEGCELIKINFKDDYLEGVFNTAFKNDGADSNATYFITKVFVKCTADDVRADFAGIIDSYVNEVPTQYK